MDERNERGGRPFGKFFARAMERRRRNREREARATSYRETGGGYPGYGGTGDREPWEPEQGRFGAGFSGYGGRPRGGGPYPGERRGPRIFRGVSRGLSVEEDEERAPARPRLEDELGARPRITWTGSQLRSPKGEAKENGRLSREARVRGSARTSVGPTHEQALRAERIGPGAYRRGGHSGSGGRGGILH